MLNRPSLVGLMKKVEEFQFTANITLWFYSSTENNFIKAPYLMGLVDLMCFAVLSATSILPKKGYHKSTNEKYLVLHKLW